MCSHHFLHICCSVRHISQPRLLINQAINKSKTASVYVWQTDGVGSRFIDSRFVRWAMAVDFVICPSGQDRVIRRSAYTIWVFVGVGRVDFPGRAINWGLICRAAAFCIVSSPFLMMYFHNVGFGTKYPVDWHQNLLVLTLQLPWFSIFISQSRVLWTTIFVQFFFAGKCHLCDIIRNAGKLSSF